jgi:hypothetical protein
MIVGLLIALVALCFYVGYKFAANRAVNATLLILEKDNIIRLVNMPDGGIEIYSGTKFYNGVEK